MLAAAVATTAQEGESGSEPSPPSEPPAALSDDNPQAALDRLPDPPGDDDAEQIRSLLGLPDAFTIAFEPQADGSSSRREQWFYYDLSAVFEFVDGTILWNLPLDSETTFMPNASRYDPAVFQETSRRASIALALPSPFSFEPIPLDDQYGVPVTICVGDQLVLAFDEWGTLFYVETVPLIPADAP
jgi:hypothetical protein